MNSQFETTQEHFEHIDFHDCQTTRICAEHHNVIIDFEYVYISEAHPLNPHPVAKSTGACRLIFTGVSVIRPIGYIAENQIIPLALRELEGMEVLSVTEKKVNELYVYDLLGGQQQSFIGFHGLILHAKGFTMHWNEFTDDAWYVGWEE